MIARDDAEPGGDHDGTKHDRECRRTRFAAIAARARAVTAGRTIRHVYGEVFHVVVWWYEAEHTR